MIFKKCCSDAAFETLKHKQNVSVLTASIVFTASVNFIASISSVSLTSSIVVSVFNVENRLLSESHQNLFNKYKLISIININEWIQKKQEFILILIFSVREIQENYLILILMRILIKYFDIIIIIIFFIFSEFFDSEKKFKELTSLLKILFLIDLSTFVF